MTELLFAVLVTHSVISTKIPVQAYLYQPTIVREATSTFGMSAPVPVFAAQLEQESGFRHWARSAYAEGLAQFTPATSKDLTKWYGLPKDWHVDPRLAIRGQMLYMRRLYNMFPGDACNKIGFALGAYNGGPGWMQKRIRIARSRGVNHLDYFGTVRNINPGIRPEFQKENQDYAQRIVFGRQHKYKNWGATACLTRRQE